MSSRASAGGAGNSGGVANENRNLAWVAAYAAADVPLPIVRTSGIRVEHIGGQTGMGVDDVGAITEQRGFVLIQAKKDLGLDKRPGSPLGKALDQVVEQYLAGVPDGSGREAALRPIDPDRDLLVMTTDPSAPAIVRAGLAGLISTLAGHPDHLALSDAAHGDQQEKALSVLLGHLRRSPHWIAHRGVPPTDADLRALFRVIRLNVLGLEPGQEQRAAAEVYLTEVLASRSQRGRAFEALAGVGGSLSEGRWWMSRLDILTWLRDNGFPPMRDPRVHDDIRKLQARSDRDLDADVANAVIGTPDGPVPIDRDIEPLLAADMGTAVIVGPLGAGKTSVAARAARAERDAGRDVVYLRAGDLIGTEGEIRNTLRIDHGLGEVLAGWRGPGPATLVIDGLDATRMAAPSKPLLRMLRGLPSRWRLIATARSFDLRYSPEWRRLFAGAPVDEARADPHLLSVRHLLVDRLSDGEVGRLLAARPELTPLFDRARLRLAELVRNPFNLNLAADLLAGNPALVYTVRSQLDLLQLYWEERVATGPEMYGRLGVLEKLAREMIRHRRDRLHPLREDFTDSDLAAIHGLLSDGVLREDQPSGYAPTSVPVAFAHALLFDFTVASQVLARPEEPMCLAEVLAAEPDWALLLRSSIDLHLAALWHDDPARESFFSLAARLTRASPLAASAAAEVSVREGLTRRDLEPLIGCCLAPDATVDRRAARAFTSQLLAGALHLRDLTGQQAATGMLALASAARRLAEAAEQALDVELATTATIIVNRIRALPGWQPEWPGAADSGMAAAAITRTALADLKGPGHEYLGHRAADLLTDAIRIDPGQHGPLVARFADPAVMAAWGVSAACVLTRGFAGIAAHAPGPAIELAVAIWTFTEERQETTYLTPSRFKEFSGNRMADLEGARHDIGTAFSAVIERDPAVAVEMYLRVIEAAVPSPTDGPESALLYLGGGTLAGRGHGALVMMTVEMAGYLDTLAGGHPADGAVADPLADVLDRLARRLRNPDAWSALLSAGTRKPATLGIRLMPLLRSGHILRVDPASRAAAGLIRAVAPTVDDDEHRRLEAEVVGIPATGYADHLRDRLLGALDRSRISDSAAKERLAALDAVGGPPPVEGPAFGPVRDISLAFPGPRRPTRLSEATQAVQESLRGLSNGTAQAQAEALARLRHSFTALLSQVDQQEDPRREGHGEYEEALAVAVTAAATLAKDPEARPGTPVGIAVLSTLLVPIGVRGNPDPEVARAEPAPEETTTIRAAEGLLGLFCRNDWAASPEAAPLETAARGLLEHDQPGVRAVAVSALPRLLPEPAARYARISELLRAESADFLRAGLVQQLSGLLHDMPAEVDRSLAELGSTGAWPVLSPVQQGFDDLSADPGKRPGDIDFVIRILIGVALLSGHDKCQHLLTTWLDQPAAFCYRAERACLHLRDWLTAGNHESAAIRRAAFALIARPVRAAAQLRLSAEAAADGRTGFDRAAHVATAVSRNLKIATDRADEVPEDFAELAFPVLEQLAQVGTPPVVHDVVRVLRRIKSSDPKRTTLTVATAVTTAPDYAWEPEGARAVLDLVETTVADHRALILGDPEWTSGLRQVLEGFVAQGVDAVVAKARDLGDMFG